MSRPKLGSGYHNLLVAASVSYLGDGAFLAAFPLLAASLTRDPRLVAGVVLAERLPWLLFAIVSGALVDRLDRRLVMGYVDGFRAVLTGVFAAAVLSGHATIPLIYVFAFVLGVAETLFDNASQAILPSVVTTDALERANSGLQASNVLSTQFAGPPLGSLLFAAAVSLPFIVDAGSFAFSAGVILLMLRIPRRTSVEQRGRGSTLRSEIGEGLRWLWRNRLLRALAIMLGVWNMLETAIWSVFVLFALEVLRVEKSRYGILLAAGALGGLVGAAVASRVSGRLGPGRSLLACAGLSVIAYTVCGAVPNQYVVGGMIGLAGLTWNVITVSLRQTIIPDRLLGRVNSLYRFVGWGTMPLGAAAGGFLAKAFGLRATFFFSAGVLVLTAALAWPVLWGTAIEDARAAATREDGRTGSSEAGTS